MRLRENEDHSRNQMSAMRKDAENEYRIPLGRRLILAAMRILQAVWSLSDHEKETDLYSGVDDVSVSVVRQSLDGKVFFFK